MKLIKSAAKPGEDMFTVDFETMEIKEIANVAVASSTIEIIARLNITDHVRFSSFAKHVVCLALEEFIKKRCK